MPDYADSEWQDCHALNAAGGLEMLEWQDGIMRCWLATNGLGRWAAPTCGGSVPRQNGKTLGLVVPRVNYGMTMIGEEVIYTSHLQKTSTETFESVATFFDGKALKKYVKDVKTAIGREQVILKNGARMKFLARTRNGGRGQHGDLLIFDEALELDAKSQASFLPAISASRNPQVIYISTPPTPDSPGAVFGGIRQRALAGESDRTCWFEWSVDEIGDVTDRSRWYATNPSLGILIQESTVESELEQMDPDTFARERLGWWSTAKNPDAVIERAVWDACRADALPCDDEVIAAGVKFSPDGLEAALSMAAKQRDGSVCVECIEFGRVANGMGWLVDFLLARKDRIAVCTIDGKANTAQLEQRLKDNGFPAKGIAIARTRDVTDAASMFLGACVAHEVVHGGQPLLTDSALCAVKRQVGNSGAWAFGSGEVTSLPVESASLAYFGAKTTRRRPGRKAVVY